jgi:hypothetical protein
MLRVPGAPPASEEMIAAAYTSRGWRHFPLLAAPSSGISRMAREHWIENLMCRRCSKDGIAVLSTENRSSWIVQVESVPEGFRVVQSDNGSNFYCSSCDRPVEP